MSYGQVSNVLVILFKAGMVTVQFTLCAFLTRINVIKYSADIVHCSIFGN